jgi:glycerol-1-phosphate dehydrogenase [NAD(P)+]
MKEEFSRFREMEFPRNIIIGSGILNEIVPLCDSLNLPKNGMMITGGQTYKAAGKIVEDYMTDGEYSISVHTTGAVTEENVNEAISFGRKNKSQFILAVGGGSKIDAAKLVADELHIPFISIPTSAAHDGIASGRASLKLDRGPKSIDAVTPMAILADTEIISKSPHRYLAAGCADVISNLTALRDWDYARRLRAEEVSNSAIALSSLAAESIIENAAVISLGNEESTRAALKPIIISGVSMAVAGSSRPTSGSEHMFSHALDLMHVSSAMHGEQCGVGTIMMMYLHGGDWQRIRTALMKIGAPVDAEGLGVMKEDIIEALMTAHKIRKDRFTILGTSGLTKASAEKAARETMVI